MTPPGPVAADETDDLAGRSPVPATTPAARRAAPNWPRRSGLRALRAALLRLAWLAGPLGRRAAGPLRTWSRMFPAIPSQAGEARRFAAAILDGHPASDDAILCLSELVSNSMRHSRSRDSGGTFTVRVRLLAGRLRVEVDDQGGAWQPRPSGDGQSGRGLSIVGQLSADWGHHAIATGRTVWFEFRDHR